MADIARACGVSRNTVSLALRKDPQIARATRKRIEAEAERMGYVRDPAIGEIMAGMRSRKRKAPGRMLALVNAHPENRALRNHPTVPTYVRGCSQRAGELGYGLDPFWMHDPRISGERFCSIFRARGIKGVIVVGMMETNRVPEHFRPVVEAFPVVVAGVRTRDPELSFACVDHHMLSLRALEAALRLGYRRPGLVLDGVIDELVEHRFLAGYRMGQLGLPPGRRLDPFLEVRQARTDRRQFANWLQKTKPDVIFTLYHEVGEWLRALGRKAPEDIGLIQYEWRAKHADWAGMNQHNDLCGAAAVDMLIGMIHRGEAGPPPFPRATLIGPTWVPGQTVTDRI
jgi:LacI family transcriptional regulator